MPKTQTTGRIIHFESIHFQVIEAYQPSHEDTLLKGHSRHNKKYVPRQAYGLQLDVDAV